jgi:hypothetical protein
MTVVVFTDTLIRDGLLVPSGKRKGEWTDEIVRCLTFERRATSPQGALGRIGPRWRARGPTIGWARSQS